MFSKQIAKVREILGSLFLLSDIKEKEEILSSTNLIFKNFPILLPVFVLVKQIYFIFSEESVCYIICWLPFVHSLKNSRKRAFVLRTVKVRDFCF